jgi:CRISPR-associated endonuclease/helicase Cas3
MLNAPPETYYAHPDHPLEEHLRSVAALAARFAEAFDSQDWAYLAGLWHDLGKFQPEFQRRLRGESIAVEHSGAGAAHAFAAHQAAALPLAFVIAGHHAGLANAVRSATGGPSSLQERLTANATLAKRLRGIVPTTLLSHALPAPPAFLNVHAVPGETKTCLEFWIRFLFSALTDAARW